MSECTPAGNSTLELTKKLFRPAHKDGIGEPGICLGNITTLTLPDSYTFYIHIYQDSIFKTIYRYILIFTFYTDTTNVD